MKKLLLSSSASVAFGMSADLPVYNAPPPCVGVNAGYGWSTDGVTTPAIASTAGDAPFPTSSTALTLMKRLLLASAAVVALAAPAFAADLPAYPTKAPAVAAYNWTGLYVGINLGGTWSNVTNTDTFSPVGAVNSASSTISGVIGGGQIGYNWQSGHVVFGLEADVDGSGQSGTSATLLPGFGTDAVANTIRGFGTARARVGFAADRWLWYVTGGFAWQNIGFSDAFTTTGGSVTGISSGSTTRTGYSVGGGIETALWDNWTGRVEYLHIDTGTWTTTTTGLGAPLAFTSVTNGVRTPDNIVRAGLNYRF
jgi:outer membrane immunogenic protein